MSLRRMLTALLVALFAQATSAPAVGDATAAREAALLRLRPALERFELRPPSDAVALVRGGDMELAVSLCADVSDLASRRALVWALGAHGSEDAVHALHGMLTNDYRGRYLERADEDALFDAVLNLGFLADDVPEAFELAKSGVNPGHWKSLKTWTSERGAFSRDLLVSYSIQSLGISGRADAPALLKQLRNRDANYLHRFAGDITQAMFYFHLRSEFGEEYLRHYMLNPDCKYAFRAWIETPLGKYWLEWANECMRGPRPPEPDSAADGAGDQ